MEYLSNFLDSNRVTLEESAAYEQSINEPANDNSGLDFW